MHPLSDDYQTCDIPPHMVEQVTLTSTYIFKKTELGVKSTRAAVGNSSAQSTNDVTPIGILRTFVCWFVRLPDCLSPRRCARLRHTAREHEICYSCKFEKLIIRRIINIENEIKFCILKKIRLIRNNKRSV